MFSFYKNEFLTRALDFRRPRLEGKSKCSPKWSTAQYKCISIQHYQDLKISERKWTLKSWTKTDCWKDNKLEWMSIIIIYVKQQDMFSTFYLILPYLILQKIISLSDKKRMRATCCQNKCHFLTKWAVWPEGEALLVLTPLEIIISI